MNATSITVEQLKRAVEIKERIAELENELAKLLGGAVPGKAAVTGITAEGRARIAEAQRARWAKFNRERGNSSADVTPTKSRKPMSAAAKAKIAAAARARWKKAKAQAKNSL